MANNIPIAWHAIQRAILGVIASITASPAISHLIQRFFVERNKPQPQMLASIKTSIKPCLMLKSMLVSIEQRIARVLCALYAIIGRIALQIARGAMMRSTALNYGSIFSIIEQRKERAPFYAQSMCGNRCSVSSVCSVVSLSPITPFDLNNRI
jgi:hypothetical protein